MAKRKKSRSRRAKVSSPRAYFRAKKGRGRSKAKATAGKLAGALGAIGYGFAREKTSMAIAPYTQWIPFGGISDEVGMFGVSMLAEKFGGRIPMIGGVIKNAGKAGQLIELARVGQALATGGIGFGAMSGGSANGATASFR